MRKLARILAAVAIAALVSVSGAARASGPTSVTIAGSLQSELGCSGDWQPDCALTHLAYDASNDVWQKTFHVPAGSFEYKGALNDSWAESYGLHAGGDNIPLSLGAARDVKFYYDHKSHWVTDNGPMQPAARFTSPARSTGSTAGCRSGLRARPT